MARQRNPVVLLHVDPDPKRLEATATVLEDDRTGTGGREGANGEEFSVVSVTEAREALERLETMDVDCIVSDDQLPDTDVYEFLDAVREDHPDVPVVLYTETDPDEIASEAFDAGADDYVQKGSGEARDVVLRNRVRDAVDLSRATRAVERTEHRYQRLIEESTDVIVIVDEHGEYAYVSPAVEEVWGYTPEELVGENGFEYVHPDDLDHVQDLFEELVANPSESVTAEFRIEHADGSWQWTEGRGRNLLGDEAIEGIVVYSRDVTEHKRRETELREHRALVRGVIETIPDVVFAFDENGDPLRDDFVVSDVPGYTEEELREKHPLEFVAQEDREELNEAIARILEEGTVESHDTAIVSKSGEATPHRVVASRLTDESGNVLGVVGTAHDISERVERERELERQIDRLDEFADIVSHDLRNPLTVAKGRLQLAREETESQHHEAIGNALGRMDGLIEGLLRMARDGETEVTEEPIPLSDFAGSCWENVRSPDATLRTETDAVVLADERRLRQLFENLFRNAVEHAGPDVTVTVGDVDSDDGFYVADDGPGIPDEWRDDLFESGVSSMPDGTGFGLYIVDQIASDHGWTVEAVDSDTGGARFEVTGVDVES